MSRSWAILYGCTVSKSLGPWGRLVRRSVGMLSKSCGCTGINRCVSNWSLSPRSLLLRNSLSHPQILHINRRPNLSLNRCHRLLINPVYHSLRKSRHSSLLHLPHPRLARLFQNTILMSICLVLRNRERPEHFCMKKLTRRRIHQSRINLVFRR
jgi:hypothetical protein